MSAAAFLNSLADEIVAAKLLPRTGGVVVGVSGGLDSMALLHAAVGLNRDAGFELGRNTEDSGVRDDPQEPFPRR